MITRFDFRHTSVFFGFLAAGKQFCQFFCKWFSSCLDKVNPQVISRLTVLLCFSLFQSKFPHAPFVFAVICTNFSIEISHEDGHAAFILSRGGMDLLVKVLYFFVTVIGGRSVNLNKLDFLSLVQLNFDLEDSFINRFEVFDVSRDIFINEES